MSKKILIIEDERSLAEEWAEYFTYEGYSVHIWWRIKDVLDGIDQLECDLVILDVMLPIIDALDYPINLEEIEYGRAAGVMICNIIKEKHPSLPILIVTVVRDPDIIEKLRKSGANMIITKPIENAELIKHVQYLLQ